MTTAGYHLQQHDNDVIMTSSSMSLPCIHQRTAPLEAACSPTQQHSHILLTYYSDYNTTVHDIYLFIIYHTRQACGSLTQ